MRIYLFLFLIVTVVLGIGSYRITNAIFASSATSQNNTFATAEVFPTATPTPTSTPSGSTTIVINEVNPNGGNDDDWIEIFNKTGNPIDISGWKISDNSSTETIPVSTIIPGNGFAVIVASSSSVIVPGSALTIVLPTTAIGNGLSPAGERILLEMADNSDVDEMSYGSVTTPFTLPAITSTPIYARNPNGQDTDLAGDWVLQTATVGVSNN